MTLYTIGFAKKTAKQFFETLIKNNVKILIDIRLNNKSQLAGFTKQDDLAYFLKAIGGIEYKHLKEFAPTEELLKGYQNSDIDWPSYEKEYLKVLDARQAVQGIKWDMFENACLLCSEPTAEKCHRRLCAEYLAKHNKDIKISHL